MKLKSLLLFGATLFSLNAGAQWVTDSVEMGSNYANDVFYSLKTGNKKIQPASDWDLAFQMTRFGEIQFNACVRANHIKRKVEVYSLHVKGSTHFTSLAAADTIGKTDKMLQLLNVDTSWGEGAFYQNRDKSQIFDYGWGTYAGPPTHFVDGDSLYLVKVNGVPYKLWIKQYISTGDSIGFKFSIASWDNTLNNDVQIKRSPNYTNRLFAYYDIASNSFIDREPGRFDWDMLFTQYAKTLLFTPNLQSYTGVLSNLGNQIADVRTLAKSSHDTAKYQNYTYNREVNNIGDDWKKFDQPNNVYITYDSVTFFIRSKASQEYYQLRFTRFDGGFAPNTGKIVFEKRFLATTSVNNVKAPVNAYSIYPNPATTEVTIMVDAKEATSTMIYVTDMTGKVVDRYNVSQQAGLNGYRINTGAYANGNYLVTIASADWKVTEKLSVAH